MILPSAPLALELFGLAERLLGADVLLVVVVARAAAVLQALVDLMGLPALLGPSWLLALLGPRWLRALLGRS